ncbi:MAG: hypothetical protein QGG09_20160 [Pirellulaceae bacterium]|jgi:hypothetical protein|nr:hypothetical protein [Pirellulaceae bacterium]HJN11684.1 hypothetical protein [Pirellulaceae bacterium]
MTASGSKPLQTVGFLTVRETEEHGYLGGYLVLNPAGRPLEFHCTVPVIPNRAQVILYGPTLKPFIYGEQIGQTLVNKANSKPAFVCVDVEAALTLSDHTSCPVLLVSPNSTNQTPSSYRHDSAHDAPPTSHTNFATFAMGNNRVSLPAEHGDDKETVTKRWQALTTELDLWEPFGRIHEAIGEAQRGATPRG